MALIKPKAVWPITIVAGVNDAIDFFVRPGGIAELHTAFIAPGTYDHVQWFPGEGTTSLASAVVFAMNSAYASAWQTGVVTGAKIELSNAVEFYLGFGGGAEGPNFARSAHRLLGFADVARGYAVLHTSDYQHQNGWYADDPVTDDTLDLPAYDRAVARAMGGQTKAIDFGVTYDRAISLAYLQPYKVFKALEDTHPNEAIERLIESGWARFRWWPDASTEAAFADYVLAPESAKSLPRNRLAPAVPLYSLTLRCWKYVP